MLRTILTQATKSTNFSALTAKFCTRVPNVPILNRRGDFNIYTVYSMN